MSGKKVFEGWTYKYIALCPSRPKIMVYLDRNDAKYIFGKNNVVKVRITIEELPTKEKGK